MNGRLVQRSWGWCLERVHLLCNFVSMYDPSKRGSDGILNHITGAHWCCSDSVVVLNHISGMNWFCSESCHSYICWCCRAEYFVRHNFCMIILSCGKQGPVKVFIGLLFSSQPQHGRCLLLTPTKPAYFWHNFFSPGQVRRLWRWPRHRSHRRTFRLRSMSPTARRPRHRHWNVKVCGSLWWISIVAKS